MKVNELIEQLKQFPKNFEVVLSHHVSGREFDVESLETLEDFGREGNSVAWIEMRDR